MKVSYLVRPAHFLAIAAFFLPIKPAPVNLFVLTAVVAVFFYSETRVAIVQSWKSKELFPLWCLLLFLLGTCFFPASDAQSFMDFSTKYGRFFLIPFLACALIRSEDRVFVGKAFLTGMALVLVLSYCVWLGVPPQWLGNGGSTGMYAVSGNPTVFKSHITHNFFMVIAIYFWIRATATNWGHWKCGMYGLLLGLALINLFGMVDGRTGWLVFLVIPLFLGYRHWGFKGLVFAGLVFAIFFWMAYFFIENIHARIALGLAEFGQLLVSKPIQGTSVGERVMYLTSGWSAFLVSPFFGYGLGGIENAVRPFTSQAGWPVFYNPHNQFLMFLLQGGLLALVLYGLFFAKVFHRSTQKQWTLAHITPVLLMYFVGNLLNSFHFDFAENVGFVLLVAVLIATTLVHEPKPT